jgi:hypothetical protein
MDRPCRAIGFIDHQEDRRPELPIDFLLMTAQDLSYLPVGRHHAAFCVGNKQHGVGLTNGSFGLGANLVNIIRRTNGERFFIPACTGPSWVNPPGIHHVEQHPCPLGFCH